MAKINAILETEKYNIDMVFLNFRTSEAQKIEVKAIERKSIIPTSFALCSCCTDFAIFSVTYSVKKIKQVN